MNHPKLPKFHKVYNNPETGYWTDPNKPVEFLIEMQPVHPRVVLGFKPAETELEIKQALKSLCPSNSLETLS